MRSRPLLEPARCSLLFCISSAPPPVSYTYRLFLYNLMTVLMIMFVFESVPERVMC
jgi:hypothetical protein